LDVTPYIPFCNSSNCAQQFVNEYRALQGTICPIRQAGEFTSCIDNCMDSMTRLFHSQCLSEVFQLLTDHEELPFCYNFFTVCGIDIVHAVPECVQILSEEEQKYKSGVAIVISLLLLFILIAILISFILFYIKKRKEYKKYEKVKNDLQMEETYSEE